MSNAHASRDVEELQEPALFSIERLGVEQREPELLRAILHGNSEITDLIVDAVGELRKAFDDRATIALEPFVDPEVVDAQPRVFVVAVTRLSFREADEILDRVLDGWWAENQSRADYLVSLATEFV